jgi:hypothetical protein
MVLLDGKAEPFLAELLGPLHVGHSDPEAIDAGSIACRRVDLKWTPPVSEQCVAAVVATRSSTDFHSDP